MSPRSQNTDDGNTQFSFKTSAVGDFNKIKNWFFKYVYCSIPESKLSAATSSQLLIFGNIDKMFMLAVKK